MSAAEKVDSEEGDLQDQSPTAEEKRLENILVNNAEEDQSDAQTTQGGEDLETGDTKYTLLESIKVEQYPKDCFRNTLKEETILEYVESFRRQFSQLFPHRHELLLCPMNEFGLRKFVCSTIRPTLCPHLWDMEDAAHFVSDFIEFHCFPVGTALPDLLPSPGAVLALRKGDALDFSNLLVCILRGAGYEAYVVSGFAQMSQTTANQTKEIARDSVLDATQWISPTEVVRSVEDIIDDGKYKNIMKTNSGKLKDSRWENFLKDRIVLDEHRKKETRIQQLMEASNSEDVDPLKGRRVHVWVLVRAGCRGIERDLYIEATTGRIYETNAKNLPYEKIESVWNENNYWVNVQDAHIKEMSLDIKDHSKWEFVFFKMEDKRKEISAESDEDKEKEEMEELLFLPPTWTAPFTVPSDELVRYPGGNVCNLFYRCTVEEYTGRSPTGQGLKLRVTLYDDDERLALSEIRESYANRWDKLQQRVIFPLEKRVLERYGRGRESGLMAMESRENDNTRVTWFYTGSRIDGLVKRQEIIGKQVKEHFFMTDPPATDATQQCIERTVSFRESTTGPAEDNQIYNVALAGETEDKKADVIEIVESYRLPDVDKPEKHIRRKIMNFVDEYYQIDYHYGKHRVSASCRTFNKTTGQVDGWEADPLEEKAKPSALRQQYQDLIAQEKELIGIIRDRERNFGIVLRKITMQDTVPLVMTPYHLAEMSKAKEDEGSSDSEAQMAKYDPLQQFLPTQDKGLNREQAEQAKEDCLRSTKNSLVERLNIITRRMHAAIDDMEKKKAAFDRSQASSLAKTQQQEDFEKTISECNFVIKIIKCRLARHEQIAIEKMKALNEVLKHHPKLDILRS